MSIRSKSNIWSRKKDTPDNVVEESSRDTAGNGAQGRKEEVDKFAQGAESPIDKPKNSRFSLGRKRTSMYGN